MVWQGIVSPAATKQYNCDAGQHPVGTGPFKFVEAVRNDHVTLEANPDYWGGKPKIDRIVFRIIPESATRMLALERNEVQILADVPPADYERVDEELGPEALPPARPDDPRRGDVQRARAVQGQAGPPGDELRRGQGGHQQGPLRRAPPPRARECRRSSGGTTRSVQPYPFDVNKAKALLKDAGYPNGLSAEMMVSANPRGYNPIGGAKLGEAVQSYLAKVGVNVKITQYEWGAYLADFGATVGRLRDQRVVGRQRRPRQLPRRHLRVGHGQQQGPHEQRGAPPQSGVRQADPARPRRQRPGQARPDLPEGQRAPPRRRPLDLHESHQPGSRRRGPT